MLAPGEWCHRQTVKKQTNSQKVRNEYSEIIEENKCKNIQSQL